MINNIKTEVFLMLKQKIVSLLFYGKKNKRYGEELLLDDVCVCKCKKKKKKKKMSNMYSRKL